MAISQSDLAAQLGVSGMTVSRAMRGENGINDKTRHKVLDAARHAGLPLPPSPRRQSTQELLHVLCTLAPDPEAIGETPFHGRLLAGLRRGASECASEIVNAPDVGNAWPLIVARRQVDGAVMVWGDEHDPKPLDCPVPAVYLFYGPPQADVVTVDNFGGGFMLGSRLAALGHRQVAFAGPDSRMAVERLAGLRTGLQTDGGGVPPQLALLERGGASGAAPLADDLLAAARQTGARGLGFTAVMAYNDYTAAQLIQRFHELGISVPGDVSVVGFDGVSPAQYDGPALTTCAMPLEELGAEASRMIYWRLEHPNALRRTLALETEIIQGESATKT